MALFSSRITPSSLLSFALIVILIFAFRLINLTSFPPFLDEGAHVAYSEQIERSGPLTLAHEGRQLYYYWLLALGVNDAAPLWMVRVATVLAALPGAAAAIVLGRRFGGSAAGWIIGLLYAFSPFHLFFDRLGLSDALSASLVMIAIAYMARVMPNVHNTNNRRREWRPYGHVIFNGALLFAAVFAKISALPYLGIPLAAFVALRPRWRWTRLVSLVIAALLVAAYALLLAWRGQDLFFYVQSGGLRTSFLDNLLPNAGGSLGTLLGYGGLLLAPLALLGLILLLARKEWYLLLVLFAPLFVLWLSARQGSRHIIVPMTLILVLAAVALSWLRRGSVASRLIMVVVTLLFVGYGALSLVNLIQRPYSPWIASADFREYVASDGGGFGLSQVVDRLAEENPTEVIGLLSNCQGLRMLAWNRFLVTCPRISPDGADMDALRALVGESQQAGVYVVVEDIIYVPQDVVGREVFRLRDVVPEYERTYPELDFDRLITHDLRPEVRVLDLSP